MRALHLLGLQRSGLTRLRYDPPTNEPLVLPSWLPEADREVLLAFYQQILGDVTLPRIEVDWGRSLVRSDARYLRHARLHHGPARDLVVVRVRQVGVDLRDVIATPEIDAFQHVAIACDHPARHETVGRLLELTQLVGTTARDLYDELAEELQLRPDGIALLEPLVCTLVNPIPVLEAYNALIRLHGELPTEEAHRDAVYRSVLGRILDDLPKDELVGLSALVLRGAKGFAEALGTQRGKKVEASLRARMVLLDGRLFGWARFLEEPLLRRLMEERIRRLADPSPVIPGLATVRSWLSEGGPAPSVDDPVRADVLEALSWINEGKLGQATDALAGLERQLKRARVTDLTRGDFWDAVGRLRDAEGRWDDAKAAFEKSRDLLERGGASPTRRSHTLDILARLLRDHDRWAEAEPLFRQALELKEEGGDTPASLGVTLSELALGLRDHDRWSEAEPLFRQALELKEEGGDTPISRGMTMHELARGLRDNGRWPEAEPLFRQALQFKERGGDTAASRAATMRELGIPDEHLDGPYSARSESATPPLSEGTVVSILIERISDLEDYLK